MSERARTEFQASFPIPPGLRDLLPADARVRRELSRTTTRQFELAGYELVIPPAFEFASVLERGLGARAPREILHFVEPETGEVAALRPDLTPQIARMVATRLSDRPAPIRICYEGTSVRRRPGRARRHRQLAQAGVELFGAPGPRGDLEVLGLLKRALQAVGLQSFLVDVGHAAIPRALLRNLPSTLRASVEKALGEKNAARLAALLAEVGPDELDDPTRRAIIALPSLHGGGASDPQGARVLKRAHEVLHDTEARAAFAEFRALWEDAHKLMGDALRIDLGELRGLDYYTGLVFYALAAGPGEPIASGGRYDDLMAAFDRPQPAVGFALQLDALSWALDAAGVRAASPPRVVVRDHEACTSRLRELGVASVTVYGSKAEATAYAKSFGFRYIAEAEGEQWVLRDVDAEQTHDLGPGDPAEKIHLVVKVDPGDDQQTS